MVAFPRQSTSTPEAPGSSVPACPLFRWRVMERWLEGVLARGDVWFATLDQIARHVLAERDRGADIRVEHFPYYTERQR